ncbi:MAG: hypothetical protein DCC52_06955 [Chloroflexi bacterium]|nr:MAG: hypothetical protein DCC52_06955 [Chloroflexota bacterium]
MPCHALTRVTQKKKGEITKRVRIYKFTRLRHNKARRRAARLTRLMRQLNHSAEQVLCFQEIQQNSYLALLKRNLTAYTHHAFERNRFAPKGGLYTATRLAVQSSEFFAYQNRGRMVSLGVADWALNKGVLVSRLQVGAQRMIVMNTHLHANYGGNWDPEHSFAKIQRDQIEHLADLVNAQASDALVIVCGDFNFPRGAFLYDELLKRTNMFDPLANDPRPTYRPFRIIPGAKKWAIPIDFVLLRLASWPRLEFKADIHHIQDTTRALPHQRFLTDHNALSLHVTWDD